MTLTGKWRVTVRVKREHMRSTSASAVVEAGTDLDEIPELQRALALVDEEGEDLELVQLTLRKVTL